MIQIFRKIWKFSGNEQKNIRNSILTGLLGAVFNSLIFVALYVVLNAIVKNNFTYKIAAFSFIFMVISILGKMVTGYVAQLERVHAGYFMVSDKRIHIGEKIKTVPMGYYNQNSLGMLTGIATTVLNEVETTAPIVLVQTLGGFLNSIILASAICIFDWRIGVLVWIGIAVFLFVTVLQEKKFELDAPKRQEAQAKLVESVLETIQGMGVVKAFQLDEQKGTRIDKAIEESCNRNIAMEKAITPYTIVLQSILKVFGLLIILLSISLYLKECMSLVSCLMMLVAAFIIYEQLESAGHGISTLRLAGASIDQANRIDTVPTMDQGTKEIYPATHEIEFRNVSFSYEKRAVLKNINFCIPEKSSTAIIGPSGSGKTTLCNLMVRFWDVANGEITLGGRNIKDYTLESLLSNFSMVFQNVYLFADTIENNIKFGKPDATHAEVVEAARKACCDDFIEALPDGYNTVLDEGGSSLSGGEKQRLSIARAMLKNAPIIILDEATANVDPENEDRLQAAIEALTHDKTIIMIAHRLKTVRNADQILVLDKGEIIQKGTHDQLIASRGIYADFVSGRKQAEGWKLSDNVKI